PTGSHLGRPRWPDHRRPQSLSSLSPSRCHARVQGLRREDGRPAPPLYRQSEPQATALGRIPTAMVAARIATLPVGANQHAEISAPAQAEAADLVNVSRESVQFARKVQQEGIPELVKAVEAGKVTVSTASKVATLPVEEQKTIVAKGPKEVRAKAKALRE